MGDYRHWLIPVAFCGPFLAGSIWVLVRGLITRRIQFDNDHVFFTRAERPIAYWILVALWTAFTTMWCAAFVALNWA